MSNKSAYKRKDGRWEVRIYTGMNPSGKRSYQSIYGKTKLEAEAKAEILVSDISPYQITDLTVRELAIECIIRKEPLLKSSTVANYRMKLKKHIFPVLGDNPISDVNTADIYAFMEKMRATGLSERYIYDILVLLKSIYRYAEITYNVKNVMNGIVMPKRTKPDVIILSDKQQEQLKAYISRKLDLTGLAILLSLYTGLRIGELCALLWEDIDLEKRILTVNKTIQRIQTTNGKSKTKLIITAPKSCSSIREIPIPEWLVTILANFKAENEAFVLSGTSKPVEPRCLQYRFARILNNVNLPSVHFHSLRHAFATNCIAKGFDVKTLSEILGHSSVEITLNRYVHSSMDRKKAFMDMLTWDTNKQTA